jgi:hypothetical protein
MIRSRTGGGGRSASVDTGRTSARGDRTGHVSADPTIGSVVVDRGGSAGGMGAGLGSSITASMG